MSQQAKGKGKPWMKHWDRFSQDIETMLGPQHSAPTVAKRLWKVGVFVASVAMLWRLAPARGHNSIVSPGILVATVTVLWWLSPARGHKVGLTNNWNLEKREAKQKT